MKNKKIRISLCNKIILIIVVALFVCTCLWTSVMFFNISNNAREVALTDEKNNMYNVSAQLKDVEETCYLVRQLVLQKNRIFEYIQKVQNNQDYKGVEKLDFYKNEIGSIDAMVDINPYIYNVKVYANANVTEKAPSCKVTTQPIIDAAIIFFFDAPFFITRRHITIAPMKHP